MSHLDGNGSGGGHAADERRDDSRFRDLLETLPAGAYICDADGLITYYNERAAQMWGRAPKCNDPVDRFCGSFKLFAGDGTPLDHSQCWMALALRDGREYNGYEVLVERPDGQRFTVLAHASPIRDAAGALVGAVNVIVDISERRRAEEAMKEADRAKNEFLATLAHELRNPLAPIRNAAQILSFEAAPTPQLTWALEVIERQMQQMSRLIDDLLDIARITGNKLDLRRERIELAQVVGAAVETSRPLLESNAQELVVNVPAEPLFLDGDATRLAQVLANLLHNAGKYTERGGRVWLTAERQGSDVVLTVRDTGIGISADMLPRIFDMFMQVDQTSDRSRGGLGLGLTLVKRLVELHGGTITAHSGGAGKGSDFVVRLPAIVDAKPQAHAARPASVTDAAPSMRILVVDDNRDSAASLGMMLRMVGNDIRTAYDGLEAVGVADEFRPEVVLLDIGLPKLNGYDVARKIRQQSWGQNMVLVALTGWGQESDRQHSKDAGFDHHLVKPVDPTVLLAMLSELERSRPSR